MQPPLMINLYVVIRAGSFLHHAVDMHSLGMWILTGEVVSWISKLELEFRMVMIALKCRQIFKWSSELRRLRKVFPQDLNSNISDPLVNARLTTIEYSLVVTQNLRGFFSFFNPILCLFRNRWPMQWSAPTRVNLRVRYFSWALNFKIGVHAIDKLKFN